MHEVVILQRVVPHYRLALFERLWRELGWCVAAAKWVPDIPELSALKIVEDDLPFIKRFDLEFPSPDFAYRCRVPVRRILREIRPTGVICEFSMYMNSTYELPLIRRLRGSPQLFFWSHGFSMERGLVSLGDRLRQLPRAFVSAMAYGHICYSEEGRAYLSRFMPRERLFVAPNTIDTETSLPASDISAPGRPHIVTVGRVTAIKEFPRLVRVFRALLADYPQAALTIVGDGPDRERTREAAGDELGRRIFMPGEEYDQARVAAYFASADLSVITGAAGLGVNHALSCGVPVVAYERMAEGPRHHPEIAYVIDGVTGALVKHHTEQAMVDALRAFLSRYRDPRAAFAESISRFVDDHLSLDGMVREFAKVDEFIRKRSRIGTGG